MKYIKLFSILFVTSLLTTASDYLGDIPKEIYSMDITNNTTVLSKQEKPIISKSKALSEKELQILFPDANFRNVITRNFKNQEITLNKISSLSGEFYATGENIEDLTGISYLTNISEFVFWNNNIKEVPKEILKLENIKSINLANNYITKNSVVNKLLKKDIDINYDLNFIQDKKNQYKLYSYYNKLVLHKGDTVSIHKLLYKYIKEYDKYWEATSEISTNVGFIVSIEDNKILNLEENSTIKAELPGKCKVKISIDDNFYKKSTVVLNIEVTE